MNVKFQDYYETLGVSRTATQEEIQRSYRKLAREHHPDLNKEQGAEEKFKQISEAYEVLKNPETRKKYDQLGAKWKSGQDFSPPEGWENMRVNFGGANAEDLGGFSDFFETIFGGQFGDRRARPGAGTHRAQRPRQQRGQDVEAAVTISLEDAHSGATKSISLQVTDRDEAGQPVRSAKTYDVKIPAGTTNGAVIRLRGQGGSGVGGGPAGDLHLRINMAPHPLFRAHGHDLELIALIAPWEAALGAKIDITTLDGSVSMTIPPGAQSGQRFRLRGKGLPRRGDDRGDLYVEVRVTVPKELSDAERRLYEQLRDESAFDPRA